MDAYVLRGGEALCTGYAWPSGLINYGTGQNAPPYVLTQTQTITMTYGAQQMAVSGIGTNTASTALNDVYAGWTTQIANDQQQVVWTAWNNVAHVAGGVNNCARGVSETPNACDSAQYTRDHEAQLNRTAEARKTADELLRANLTPSQLREMDESKVFTVISKTSRRRYRIRTDKERHGNIEELDAQNRAVASYCGAPGGNIPIGDALLGQKLMLECAEDEFLRFANKTPLRRAG